MSEVGKKKGLKSIIRISVWYGEKETEKDVFDDASIEYTGNYAMITQREGQESDLVFPVNLEDVSYIEIEEIENE